MFRDSCVTELTPWSVREEATALPAHIMPAYVGSGRCVLSIDASGLQGLNHGVQSAFGAVSGAGDMYLIKEYMVGNQLSEDNVLPLGYLEWQATVDGVVIDGASLPTHASCWERVTYIDEAKVVTRMLLDARVALEIAVWQPLGTDSTVLEITVRGHDVENKPIDSPRQITLQLRIVLKTRQGAPLYARCTPRGTDLEVEFDGHERYLRRYRMVSSAGTPPVFADGCFDLTWSVAAGSEPATCTCLLSIDERHGVDDVPKLRREHLAAWHRYFGSVTHIEGLDARETFLFHNSLYLLHSGFSFDRGVALGNGFAHPWCWRASTFWDSTCVMDALLRVGELESARKLLAFLQTSMRTEGKPFSWMFLYDGTSTIEDKRDMAPLVIATHAATAIRAFEYLGDRALLEQTVFPICKAVSDYAVATLFTEVDGKWIISTPVSHDVVDDVPVEVNQTYTTLWFLVVLRKTLDYARTLDLVESLDERHLRILEGWYLEHDDDEYLHARGVTAREHSAASWLPFLLYPTEGMPFVDRDLYEKTCRKYDFSHLYMEKQGCYQPWSAFMEACSHLRRDDPERAQAKIEEGQGHVFGPGLFSEIGPRQQTVGLPPYMSAHVTYIAARVFQWVGDSIWEKKLEIFSRLPACYRDRDLRIARARCRDGIEISGTYRAYDVEVYVEGDLEGYRLMLPLPRRLQPGAVRCFIDGQPAPFTCSTRANGVVIAEIAIDRPAARYDIRLA